MPPPKEPIDDGLPRVWQIDYVRPELDNEIKPRDAETNPNELFETRDAAMARVLVLLEEECAEAFEDFEPHERLEYTARMLKSVPRKAQTWKANDQGLHFIELDYTDELDLLIGIYETRIDR